MEFLGQLKPFHQGLTLELNFSFSVSKSGGWILDFKLAGEGLQSIVLPSTSLAPARSDKLWEMTCFELFCSPVGRESYLEMNFSPSKNWNIYSFESYRSGMKPYSKLTTQVETTIDPLKLNVRALVSGDMPGPIQDLEIGVSAVIQNKNKQIEYWALTHSSEKPDFHLRENWTGRMPK